MTVEVEWNVASHFDKSQFECETISMVGLAWMFGRNFNQPTETNLLRRSTWNVHLNHPIDKGFPLVAGVVLNPAEVSRNDA